MVIRRDSLRAQTDFFSPMTGNTGTQIRYADAPIPKKDTYGSQVKKRLSDIGKGTRRAAPIMEAIKVAVQKTDDPFTQIAEKKSYAPPEENDLIGQLEGAAGAAQDAVSEGVSQVQEVVRSTGRRAAKRREEQQLKRQQERAADLKAAETARQNIRTDFQNRVRGVSDEVSGVRQQVKTYESNREKQRRLTQARLKGIESDVGGVRSEVKAYESNRERQRRLTQARLKGIESKQEATRQETAAYRLNREKQRALRQQAVDKRLGDQEKKVGEVKTNLATTYGGVVGLRESLAAIKAKREAPKTVTVGGQTVAAKQSVASLPSNYKATEAAAFKKAEAFQKAKGIAQRNPNVSINKEGRAEATNNTGVARAQAAAVNRKIDQKSISQVKSENKQSMQDAARKRNEAFKKAKAQKSGRGFGGSATQGKNAPSKPKAGSFGISAAGRKKAAANRAAAKKKASAAKKKAAKKKSSSKAGSKSSSRGARGGTSSRSRGGAGGKGGSKGGSKSSSRGARGGSSSRSRGGTSRGGRRGRTGRGGRRGGRRCDIRCKVNISLLTNMNLLRDDLADVAYFVRELREIEL